MPTQFIATQKLEELRLKVKHLAEYLDSEVKIENDGYVDDPDLNFIVQDIKMLHDEITP